VKNNNYFCINCGMSKKHGAFDNEVIECPNCHEETMMNIGDKLRPPAIKNKKNPKKEIKKFLKEIINPRWRKKLTKETSKKFNDLLDEYLGKYLPGKGKLAVISMSGGLDSATLCAEALSRGYDVFVLNFNYNQKNWVEQIAFQNLLNHFETRKDFDGRIIGSRELNLEPLFGEFLDLWAEMRDNGQMKEKAEHQFYTPSRNLLFSVMSAVVGEIVALNKEYDEISVGLGIHMHTEDAYGEHRNYWDITPEFARKLSNLFALNDVKKITLFTPFVNYYKDEIVKRAVELKVPYKLTWTCYNPQQVGKKLWVPCEECEACVERKLAGEKAGVDDINEYYVEEN